MMRALAIVCASVTVALAEPNAPGITAEPAPSPSAPPPAYAPPPSNAPSAYSYEAPGRRPDRAFFALGVVGGGADDWLYGAYHGEFGLTILPDPSLTIRARAFGVLYGGSVESDWNGGFWRYGIGAEGRMCGGHTCFFVDLDAGFERLTLYDGSSEFVRSDTGVVAGPRVGFDFGGAIRVRFALELYEHLGQHRNSRDETSFARFETIGLSLGVGYQL